MKSRLFAEFDPASDRNRQFARDLREMLIQPAAEWEACLLALPDFRLAQTESEREDLVKELAKKIAPTRFVAISQSLTMMDSFLGWLTREELKDDSLDQWVEDLQYLKQLDGGAQISRFRDLIQRIREQILPKISDEIRRRRYGIGVLPVLESCGVTVELRAVQQDRFRWGASFDLYKPQVVGVMPVFSFAIGLDVGSPSEFYFQATEKAVDLLIAQLKAAKKDLAELQNYVNK